MNHPNHPATCESCLVLPAHANDTGTTQARTTPATCAAPAPSALSVPPAAFSTASALPTVSAPTSRRALLGVGAALGALLLPRARAQADAPPPAGVPPQWKNINLRLARRVTMGLDIREAETAVAMGFTKYLEYQLNPAAIDDSAVEDYIARAFPTLAMSYPQLIAATDNLPQTELARATVYRALFSKCQLLQRMTEFWTYHFNIDIHKVNELKTIDDRDVIRPNALGKFADLLKASAHSPAMLDYLDNSHSRREHPNQNYAREMMELHTLGVNGGYTQTDVSEVARCFTGWTRNFDKNSVDWGKFVFDIKNHDQGAKIVMGQTIAANGGIADGERVLDIVANHPSTATFISAKLLHWLLREDAAPNLVAQIAKVFTSTKGDIKAVIRAILTPALLKAAPAKYKRPSHLVASAVRATAADVTELGGLTGQLNNMGQPPFAWSPPNGYPDALGYWAGLILPRWNFALGLMDTHIGGVKVDVAPLLALHSTEDMIVLINVALYAGEMTDAQQSSLSAYLGNAPTEARLRDAIGLTLASSDFQLY